MFYTLTKNFKGGLISRVMLSQMNITSSGIKTPYFYHNTLI